MNALRLPAQEGSSGAPPSSASDRALNSGWEDGDWDGDGEFSTSDLVLAFQSGYYIAGATKPTKAIAAAVDVLFSDDDEHSKRFKRR